MDPREQVREGIAGERGKGPGGPLDADQITLALRAAEELRAAAALMADAQRIANFGSWEWRIEDDHVSWSQHLYEILGLSQEGHVPSFASYLEAVHVEDRQRVADLIQGSSKTGKPFQTEHRIVQPDGGERWLRCHGEPASGSDGGVDRLVGVCQDITELVESERARADADARFRGAFEHAPIGVALLDFADGADGRLTEVNHSLCELTARSTAELVGATLSSLFLAESDTDPLEPLERLLAGEVERVEVERRCLIEGDRIALVQLNVSAVRDAEGVVLHGIAQLQDVTERKRFEEQLRYVADHDSMTGLLNRRRFGEELASHLAYKRRYGGRGALLVVDVDRLKRINDTQGHGAGDAVLRAVAEVLRRRVRSTDIVARLGGDEFAVLLPNADPREADAVASDLVERLAAERVGGLRISASVGVRCFGDEADETSESVIADADAAMYRSKQSGGGTVEMVLEDGAQAASRHLRAIADPPSEPEPEAEGKPPAAPVAVPDPPPEPEPEAAAEPEAISPEELGARVREAIRSDSLLLYVQPAIDLRSGQVAHQELLVRMRDAAGNIIPAVGFLAAASTVPGVCQELDRWVTGTAMRLLSDGMRAERLHVNLSGETFADDDALERLSRTIGRSSIAPGQLAFEIGEREIDHDVERAADALARLGASGTPLVLDGFSGAFGSFDYLQRLPLDQIKIDAAVVKALDEEGSEGSTLGTIVRLARGAGRDTVAKLVESDSILPLLRLHGVDMAQGFELGAPHPVGVAA